MQTKDEFKILHNRTYREQQFRRFALRITFYFLFKRLGGHFNGNPFNDDLL
jgi:hypothetical protein